MKAGLHFITCIKISGVAEGCGWKSLSCSSQSTYIHLIC